MSSAPDVGATVAPGAQEQPDALGGAPIDAPAAMHGGAADADDDAAGQKHQRPAPEQEEEEQDDVLMLPAFQTGDMVVCPNPRRAGLLWPVSGGALVLGGGERRKHFPRLSVSPSRRPLPLSPRAKLTVPSLFAPHSPPPLKKHQPPSGRHRRPAGGPRRGSQRDEGGVPLRDAARARRKQQRRRRRRGKGEDFRFKLKKLWVSLSCAFSRSYSPFSLRQTNKPRSLSCVTLRGLPIPR